MKEVICKGRALWYPVTFIVLCGLAGCVREWRPVMRTADMTVELDATTIQRRGPIVTLTTMVQPSNATTYRIVTQQIHCGEHAYRQVQSTLYDFDHTLVPERADQPSINFRPISGAVERLHETLYQQACR